MEQRGRVGSQTNYWSDWRTDVRIKGTSDPTAPDYREWTHREIWDFITQNGLAADPRQVRHRTASPTELAHLVEQGARFHPETEDWIASLGKLIQVGTGPMDGAASWASTLSGVLLLLLWSKRCLAVQFRRRLPAAAAPLISTVARLCPPLLLLGWRWACAHCTACLPR